MVARIANDQFDQAESDEALREFRAAVAQTEADIAAFERARQERIAEARRYAMRQQFYDRLAGWCLLGVLAGIVAAIFACGFAAGRMW